MQENLAMWKEEVNELSDKGEAWDWVEYNVRLQLFQLRLSDKSLKLKDKTER